MIETEKKDTISNSRKSVCEAIENCEKRGEFDVHVDPIDYSLAVKVDENFHYIKTPIEKIKIFFQNLFIVKPFSFLHTRRVMKLKIKGRHNLKGIKSAVVVCNHVYIFDCLAAKRALKGHKLMVTAADFNNRGDFLGEMMRAGGLMPLGSDFSAMKNFNRAVEYYLKKGYVLFYPEQAMWWQYEKPRPFKDGAFHYAAKHAVPVIPLFITFRKSGKKTQDGLDVKYFTINILPAIYPEKDKGVKENTVYLRDASFQSCREKYEDNYGIKLEYAQDGNEKVDSTI